MKWCIFVRMALYKLFLRKSKTDHVVDRSHDLAKYQPAYSKIGVDQSRVWQKSTK